MTYVPIVRSPQPTDTDHRDLITALKLLSGEACVRDARQAQAMLVGLTESRHADVAEDARAIMQAGLAQRWFEDAVPNYYTLRAIAERSIAAYEKGPNTRRQLLLVMVGGVVALLLGVFVFLRQSGADLPSGSILWIVAALAVALGIVALFKARNDS